MHIQIWNKKNLEKNDHCLQILNVRYLKKYGNEKFKIDFL